MVGLSRLHKYDRILPPVKSLVPFLVTDVDLSNVELVLTSTELVPSGVEVVLMFLSVFWLASVVVVSV